MKFIKEVKKFIYTFTRNKKYTILKIVRISHSKPDVYANHNCYNNCYDLHTITSNTVDKCIVFKSKFISTGGVMNVTIINMSEDDEVIENSTFYYAERNTEFIYLC